MRALSFSTVGLVLAATACQPASHPDRLAETLFNNVCHFNFDCCTPSERAVFSSLGGGATSKAACVEELNDTFGGAFNIASAAVENGTAVYDAEEAERCSIQAAIDSCDAQTVLGVPENQGFNQLLFGIDATDPLCAALAQRAFVRGTVADGDACTNSVDCADFGTCVFDDDDETEGTCRAPAKEGEDCAERSCGVGLRCNAENQCAKPAALDDGEACSDSVDCVSGSCNQTEGECSVSGEPCSVDEECFDGESCSATAVCGAAPKFTVEICDGL